MDNVHIMTKKYLVVKRPNQFEVKFQKGEDIIFTYHNDKIVCEILDIDEEENMLLGLVWNKAKRHVDSFNINEMINIESAIYD